MLLIPQSRGTDRAGCGASEKPPEVRGSAGISADWKLASATGVASGDGGVLSIAGFRGFFGAAFAVGFATVLMAEAALAAARRGFAAGLTGVDFFGAATLVAGFLSCLGFAGTGAFALALDPGFRDRLLDFAALRPEVADSLLRVTSATLDYPTLRTCRTSESPAARRDLRIGRHPETDSPFSGALI